MEPFAAGRSGSLLKVHWRLGSLRTGSVISFAPSGEDDHVHSNSVKQGALAKQAAPVKWAEHG